MSPQLLKNKIATFHLNPDEVAQGLETKSSRPLVGTIISVRKNPDGIRGDIPDHLATIRGRTGKEATVSVTDNYVRIFPDWPSAIDSLVKEENHAPTHQRYPD